MVNPMKSLLRMLRQKNLQLALLEIRILQNTQGRKAGSPLLILLRIQKVLITSQMHLITVLLYTSRMLKSNSLVKGYR